MYFTIRNNVTNKYIKQNFLDYDGGEYEFWRNSTDPNIQNSTDPNGYFSIGTFDSYNFLHIENRLGYVQSTKRRDLNSGWWSKDWYLEPAY
jgi:hypothetical protein